MKFNNRTKGRLAAVAAAFIWGFSGLLIKIFNVKLGHSGITIIFMHLLIATTLLLVFARKKIDFMPKKSERWLLFFMGLIFFLVSLTFVYAFLNTTIATTEFLHYLMPVWVFLIAALWLKERVTKAKVFAVLLAIAGALLIFEVSIKSMFALGSVLAIASGAGYAFENVIGRRLKKCSPWTTTFWANLISLIMVAPFFIFGKGLNTITSAFDVLLFIPYTIIITIAANFLLFYSLGKTEASEVSVILVLEAVFAAAIGWSFLGEGLSFINILGGVLVLGSAVFITLTNRKK